MTRSTTLVPALAMALLLSGCGAFKLGNKPKTTPTLGNRVSVLVNDRDIQVDATTAGVPMVLPEAFANTDWTMSGGNAAHDLQHVALGATLTKGFDVSIGMGDSATARLASGPVVGGGRVFTIDNSAEVRAFDAASGALRWSARFGAGKTDRGVLYGGGVAFDNGVVYATNGLGYVAALDAATGKARWIVQPAGTIRGAPTLANGAVYLITQDNQIFALSQLNGEVQWSAPAALEVAGIFGASSPAIAQGTVVAGFSSGELNAYRYENGRQVWGDTLSRTSTNTSVSALSDVDADPVVSEGVVYGLGQGGRMVALDLFTGQRLWEANIAGLSTPWVAGDWLFAVTDKARLVAMQKLTGRIRWIAQLPQWVKSKSQSGPIYYAGPVLAGGRLVLTSTRGTLTFVDPDSGKALGTTSIGDASRFEPVVAGGRLYLLTNKGRLISYR